MYLGSIFVNIQTFVCWSKPILKFLCNMSKMVTKNLQKQLNQVGDKDEQIPNEMQEDACNKKVINTLK